MKLLGFVMLLAAGATTAFALNPTPEIDPASGVAALVLLGGGLLVLRSRRGRTK